MTERRLPLKQLVILVLCRFAEPIALTSVYPYLPEMIESFGVPENDIARWAGLTSAIFSVSQCLTGIPWGAASDKFGRKPIILIGLLNTMITMLVWGFSTSLPMAITARLLMGLGNGNVGILRTAVAEMCPWKELQPRAFSIMPLSFTIGAIIGPTLGGGLSNPLQIDVRKPRGDKFFERFPYVLPNLVAAGFFSVGIITGFLFFKETLETRKYEKDYGILLGQKLTSFVRKVCRISTLNGKGKPETEPLLDPTRHIKSRDDEESRPDRGAKPSEPEAKPRYRDILNTQTSLNLLVYTLLALYSLAYDQLLPVFMHHPTQPIDDPNVLLPLKFSGGFGIDSRRIGIIFTFYSVICMAFQFFIFPPVARHFGVLACLRFAFLLFPFTFIITPFTALLPTPLTKEAAILTIMIVRGLAGAFAFPTSTIMITNSASSLRVLGTLNGLATSVSAVGRAVGPAIGGSVFSLGVKHGYVVTPFWVLAAISLLASIPTWYLVEGKGFGDDPDPEEERSSVSLSGEESDEDVKLNVDDEDAIASESEYGEPTNLLSYTSTRSSSNAFASDADDESELDEDHLRAYHGMRQSGIGSHLHSRRRESRGRRTLRKRSSVPVGMGIGFRKLSSNLGSAGLGGTSWAG
ncbi:MFS general substrate transporter [Delitschia confertaspora ATCC 74209]|uniref:MFS general substrate transporter n=1 Tax=Delitschia confertaspora ATCC 74209 TaxID=1513339 RepID=A0A9P4JJU9_9PLEO|nr:MFS general substrate transporter [Delitschia confertaspora ATCC 74209]